MKRQSILVLVTMNYWEEPTSVILVSGGLIDAQLTVSHSQVEIWGGSVLDNLQFHENSLINILNGVIDGAVILGSIGLTFSGWLLRKRRMM